MIDDADEGVFIWNGSSVPVKQAYEAMKATGKNICTTTRQAASLATGHSERFRRECPRYGAF